MSWLIVLGLKRVSRGRKDGLDGYSQLVSQAELLHGADLQLWRYVVNYKSNDRDVRIPQMRLSRRRVEAWETEAEH